MSGVLPEPVRHQISVASVSNSLLQTESLARPLDASGEAFVVYRGHMEPDDDTVYCCHVDCERDAEWLLWWGGSPEQSAHACSFHIHGLIAPHISQFSAVRMPQCC